MLIILFECYITEPAIKFSSVFEQGEKSEPVSQLDDSPFFRSGTVL